MRRAVFDPLLGTIETIVNENSAAIRARHAAIATELTRAVHGELPKCTSRSAQFETLHRAIASGEDLFQRTCKGLPKETLMAIARRAPESFLDGADLLLATLIIKYGVPDPDASWSTTMVGKHALGLAFTPETVGTVCDLMAIARTMNHLRGMARWLGKGGKLTATENGGLRVDLPDAVKASVEAYERRRVEGRLLDGAGFFAPEPEPASWSQHRIPFLLSLGSAEMIQAPAGSDLWLGFERFPTMRDGSGLASILRAYETALSEVFKSGADAISHTLTALAVLIHDNTPKFADSGGRLAFAAEETPQETEHKIGFAFGLTRKGFLRFPRPALVYHLGRVRTPFAPDQATGERLASEFLDAFLMSAETARTIDPIAAREVPFLHPSTEDHIYVDLLLIGDFLGSLIEAGKSWYASQHGDRFLLDLKRFLEEAVPGVVIGARRPIELDDGGKSDIDLLARDRRGLIVVECKAYAKSRSFFIGEPGAVTQRRGRLRSAMAQAQRISDALARDVAAGKTEFPPELPVRPLVCSPAAEFLHPFDEFGLERPDMPRIVTPEELVEVFRHPLT